MRSTFGGLEISKRSLFAQQTALQTTAHNMANANTAGYTRQTVNLVASRPIEAVGLMRSTHPGQLGQGVEFDYIKRIRESFLDHQFHHENQSLGEWTIRADTLEKLEAIMNEPSDTGIRQVIEGFWNAWQELSKTPENLTARILVKERALALTDAFNHTARKLNELSADLTENIEVKAKEANSIIGQIARLNNEIYRIEGLGNNANDLRDQRDLLVDQLSKIVNITFTEQENGYSISMGNTELVNGRDVLEEIDSAFYSAAYASGDLRSGEVYGMIYSRDHMVSNYKYQLDSMVQTLVNGEVSVTLPKGTVVPAGTTINGVTYNGSIADRTLANDLDVVVNGINGLHRLGYVDGDPSLRMDFFSMKPGATALTAESFTVNPLIVNNVSNIATSNRVVEDADGNEVVVKGNNELALMIAGLRDLNFKFDSSGSGSTILSDGTFDEFFRSMIGELGIQTQEAVRQETNQFVLVQQVDSRRQSISGVSLDEEMANMIKFQHAYNAAARALTTFDEMLEKVINGMGIVGR